MERDIVTQEIRLTEKDIEKGLLKKEFELHFQPRIQVSTGKMTGAEALLRWEHPIYGKIPPNQCIPLAEANGLIIPIGIWTLETAFWQVRYWTDQGHSSFVISLNLSIKSIEDPVIYDVIEKLIRFYKVEPSRIEIEITETSYIENTRVYGVVEKLRLLGIRVAIDDFGVGYSSLHRLKSLHADTIKIDRSFIQNIYHSREDQVIVSSIMHIANHLGKRVVAEGIEKYEQVQVLKSFGCHEMQGFLFSKAVSPDDFELLLEEDRRYYH